MTTGDARTGIAPDRASSVEHWYRAQIRYYASRARHSRLQWLSFEIAAIVLTGSTPVIVAITRLPTPVKAAPAALAAILTSLSLRSGLREDHVRWTMTRWRLEYEHQRLTMRMPPYRADATSDEAAVLFFERAIVLSERELSEWYQGQQGNRLPPETPTAATSV